MNKAVLKEIKRLLIAVENASFACGDHRNDDRNVKYESVLSAARKTKADLLKYLHKVIPA